MLERSVMSPLSREKLARPPRADSRDEEFVTQVEIVELLRASRRPGWIFFAVPNGEARTKRVDPKTGRVYCPTGSRLRLMGVKRGVSDLILISPQALVHALEIKAQG